MGHKAKAHVLESREEEVMRAPRTAEDMVFRSSEDRSLQNSAGRQERKLQVSQERGAKLEELGKAALRLRKRIKVIEGMAAGTVPVEAIKEFDETIERLKQNGSTKSK